jgi:hypothetical protein
LNLNGLWQFARAAGAQETPPVGRPLAREILVPFPVESALSGIMERAERVWYRREFTIPAAWKGKRVLLHFGAVDWEATVWVNGKRLGVHRGGYDPITFDLTGALTASGSQELVVGVFDPTDQGEQPRGKQVNRPEGIYYTPTTGIWQTVWLEPVGETAIGGLTLTPDVDGQQLQLTVAGDGAVVDPTLTVEALALDGSRTVGRTRGRPNRPLTLPVPQPKLWSPDRPFLYGLKVRLLRGDRPLDEVESYFGMRKVGLVRAGGAQRLALNGKPLFQVGTLDQGYWPDGLYTAPTDAALRSDIEVTKRLGFNMIRKHVKVEPARWYYWADKLGVVVWQDMPSGNNKTAAGRQQFETELRRMVDERRNSPAIVMWVVFNEGWGQYDTERLTRLVKEWDPGRLANNASGWTDQKVGDVIDWHSYPAPRAPQPEPARAAVVGEFGGLALGVDGHTWTQKIWGYQGTASQDQLTRRYGQLLRRVWAFHGEPGISAAVYTQITDVETEANGLLTYDRAVVKVDPARVVAANQGKLPPLTFPLPAAPDGAARWRYTLQQPAADWFRPGFDDGAWQEGPSGFGTRGTPGAVIGTEWNSPDIWLRRAIDLPAGKTDDLFLWVHHDEDVAIYLNGVLAATAKGYTTDYDALPITPEARATLRPGRNLIAVHCHQTGGGQYVDVGLVRSP